MAEWKITLSISSNSTKTGSTFYISEEADLEIVKATMHRVIEGFLETIRKEKPKCLTTTES